MQSWISIVTAIGDLLTLAAAVTDLAAARARARRDRLQRHRGNLPMKAITARYHTYQDKAHSLLERACAHLHQQHH